MYMVGPAFSINYSEPHPLGKHPDVYRLQLFSSFISKQVTYFNRRGRGEECFAKK